MVQNMIVLMECPDCIEINRFITGFPKKGDTFHCPTCGEMIVVRAKFLNELMDAVDGIHDSIDRFIDYLDLEGRQAYRSVSPSLRGSVLP